MRWKRVRGPVLEAAAAAFLEARESRCVAAASRYIETGEDLHRGAAWLGFDGEETRSLLYFAASGALYPVLDEPGNVSNRRAISLFAASRRVRSIQGEAAAVAAAERAFESAPARFFVPGRGAPDSIDYDLMLLSGDPLPEAFAAGPPELRVVDSGALDADRLFPLQAAYELEEVVPPGAEFNAPASRLALDRALRSGRPAVHAELDGRIIGTARANARAVHHDQLGSVYVAPELRGRGIATRLSAELCARIRAEGRSSALFVKKRNAPARAVYERVGFDVLGDYRIVYYI